MNEVTGEREGRSTAEVLEREIGRYDETIARGKGLFNDDQLRRIGQLRNWRGDRLRTARFQRIVDPRAMPLIAIRLQPMARKSLGGIQTDLGCASRAGKTASRSRACTRSARPPASVAAAYMASARWRARSSADASSPAGWPRPRSPERAAGAHPTAPRLTLARVRGSHGQPSDRFDYVTVGHVTRDVIEDQAAGPSPARRRRFLQRAAGRASRAAHVDRHARGSPEIEELIEPIETSSSARDPRRAHHHVEHAGPARALAAPARLGGTNPRADRTRHRDPAPRARRARDPVSWGGHADFVGITPQGLVRRWEKATNCHSYSWTPARCWAICR